jgi:hypothetical protein
VPDRGIEDEARTRLKPFVAAGEELRWARRILALEALLPRADRVSLAGSLVSALSVGVTAERVLAVRHRRLRRATLAFTVARAEMDLAPRRISVMVGDTAGTVVGLVVPTGTTSFKTPTAYVLVLAHYGSVGETAGAVEELIALVGETPPEGSVARRMFNESRGLPYEALRTLEDARAHPDGAIVLEGDFGGQIYVTCPATLVGCSEPVLADLLGELDRIAWAVNEGEGAGLHFEVAPVGSGVAGGMGGALVEDGVWVHPEFETLGVADEIRAVVLGIAPAFRAP